MKITQKAHEWNWHPNLPHLQRRPQFVYREGNGISLMNSANVVSIHVARAPAGPVESVREVRAIAGHGLEGDRYFNQEGTLSKDEMPDREVTLIELEAIEALQREYQVELQPGDARRNIVTRGIALNHLVGREFRAGDAVLRGLRLCEPCGHLEKLTLEGVKKGLIHRGGLRAQIIRDGVIRTGDSIAPA